MIPFEVIRDDGPSEVWFESYSGVDAFLAEMRAKADLYPRDRQEGQEAFLELWCEAAGMVPQLQRVAAPYGVPIFSAGGQSSVSSNYQTAGRVCARDVPTLILHVGDYDPTGESIFDVLEQDVGAFAADDGGDVEFLRVAVTPEQIAAFSLPTAPPKQSDSRTARWEDEGRGGTCQAEALPPDELARIVEAAILAEVDADALESMLELERTERAELARRLDG
jgi:hypothetical protein